MINQDEKENFNHHNVPQNQKINLVKVSKSSKFLVEFREIKIEKFLQKNKKFPFLKGDEPVEEVNETIFSNCHNKKSLIDERQPRKSSIVFKDFSKEDLKLMKERELTPVFERFSNKFNIQPVELETNHSLEKHRQKNSPKKGKFCIISNENSTIKLPINCKKN
jgi:hypothetical protein